MNTDPNRRPGDPARDPSGDPSGRARTSGAEDAVAIGAALRPVEDRLRRGLATESRTITPHDRLGAILAEAHGETARAAGAGGPNRPGRPHRWLVPVAAAAAAVLVAGGVWAAVRGADRTPPVAGPPPTAIASTTAPTQRSTPSASQPSSIPTQTAQGPTSQPAPPVTTRASVPVYYVGPLVAGGTTGGSGSSGSDLRLFREFVRTDVTTPDGPESRALAGLAVAMGAAPGSSSYVSAWSGVRPLSVNLDASGRIVVTLSGGLPSGSPVAAGLAVQQLVWTAQAGVGQGTKPVVLTVRGGGDVAPGVPSGTPQQRPADDLGVYEVLSPLWVDEPARGATLPAGRGLTVNGIASTFEANVEWQVLRGTTVVARGSTTARAAAPQRGPYSFRTPALTAGSYVVRVLESSAKDGSVAAEQRIPVTVR